ncbi:MAG: UDP-N-acetylmuramoylalanyl-D-glutamate--2,6-diaminopimelate ligase, partial [Spirochaetales bacterium]|nr:UDP-N-acetylmuramoylalanyl-D-glutamate--2,6-diaminopimelate ligase [Spirochaetales bacterium]
TIIDDTYNASLDSTSTIVDYLSSLSWRGAKRVVLGPMKELGSQSARAHRTIGRLLASSSFGQTYLYGSEMQAAKEELTRHGYRGQLVWTEDFEELSEQVQNQTQRGDLVLLKASRSVAIDRLIAPLQGRWSAHA